MRIADAAISPSIRSVGNRIAEYTGFIFWLAPLYTDRANGLYRSSSQLCR